MWVSSQVPTKFPKTSGDRMSNPNFMNERGTNSPIWKPTCGKCGKKHYADCLKGKNNCFGYCKSVHNVSDCPMLGFKTKVVVKLKQVVLVML